jgi:hypothetical protein
MACSYPCQILLRRQVRLPRGVIVSWPGGAAQCRGIACSYPCLSFESFGTAALFEHKRLQHFTVSDVLLVSQHRPFASTVDCRRALRLADRRPFTHSHQLQVFSSFARRRCLRATHIFALCSDHCKKNNGNNERNAFVNPFWVEHDLNPYIKPYRQYRSAFFATAITPSVSEHPLHTVLTPEVRQSPASTVSQEVEIINTTPASPPPSQSHQVAPSPALVYTALQDSASPIETEVAESPSVPLSEEASPVNHT